MIRLSDEILLGDSDDEIEAKVDAILNVAKDLTPTREFPDIDYMHVGLVDGPGNSVTAYCAAYLALRTLLERNDEVLICCHSGTRSLVVAAMWFNVKEGGIRHHVSVPWARWMSLDERIEWILKETPFSLAKLHEAHYEMFDKIPFSLLEYIQ